MSKLLSALGIAERDFRCLQSRCRSWGQEGGLGWMISPSLCSTSLLAERHHFTAAPVDIMAHAGVPSGHPLGTSDSGPFSPSLQE